MHKTKNTLLSVLRITVAAVALGGAGLAHAAWPDKPIKIVVGFPPGQATDIIARLFAKKLSEAVNQPVVVENRAGAAGIIATEQVARAPADGYTLLVGSSGTMTINPLLYSNLRYDAVDDFAPVSVISTVPLFLAVNAELPAKTPEDLVKLAKDKPGGLNYGSAGTGVTGHLTMELFKHSQGIDVLHVPYQGSPAAISDLIGNQVQMMFETSTALLPHMQSRKVVALAVASRERNAAAPDVPTMKEAGMGDFEALAWVGLSAPKGTPPEVMNRLQDVLANHWKDADDVRQQLAALGAESAAMPSEDFAKFIREETDKWRTAIDISGTKIN